MLKNSSIKAAQLRFIRLSRSKKPVFILVEEKFTSRPPSTLPPVVGNAMMAAIYR
jgi:hypothetical protein